MALLQVLHKGISMSLTKVSFSMITGAPVNVLDYGANTIPGTTDMTSIVQAAVTAGTQVYFPAGTYLLTGAISLHAGNELYGDGIDSTIIKYTGTAASFGAFTVDSGASGVQFEGISIHDMTLYGGSDLLGFSEFVHLISLSGVNNCNIYQVKLKGFRGDGVYLGSGTSGGIERHNINVTVRDCVFDGINNTNRNGISVIDGDSITIFNNYFTNCTKSTMPGCIDVEPDGNIWHVVRNIRIVSNNFAVGNGGNFGYVGLQLAAANFTTTPTGFVIHGNTFIGAGSICISIAPYSADLTPKLYDIVISNNVGYDIYRAFAVAGGNMRGLTISGNAFYQTGTSTIGQNDIDVLADAIIANNIFGGTTDGIATRGMVGVAFSGNIFKGCPNYAVRIGANSTSTSSGVLFTGNIFDGVSGNTVIHNATDIGISNVWANNITTNTTQTLFKAFRTDDCGGIANGTTATTFNFTTLPDSFPVGQSVAIINGDATGPSGTGGNQGTLINYKYTPQSGYEKFQYQNYYHADNGLKLGSFWLRRRSEAANTWEAWSEVIGV
jgi:hypothetical protein